MSTQGQPSPEYSRLLQRTLRLQRESSREFNFALRRARQAAAKNRIELALSWCEYGASLAMLSNPGFFYSREMEQFLSEIGKSYLPPADKRRNSTEVPKRFLHIMTVAYERGGHTRAVSRWIETCTLHAPSEHHSILISMQGGTPLPAWLEDSAQNSGGELFTLSPKLSRLQAAEKMRTRALEFDAIVLHIHPNDLLPNIAFFDRPRPVLFFNHADHLFSLGTEAAQVIADIRVVGLDLSMRFRSPRARKLLLPLPLLDNEVPRCDKSSARKKLELPADAHIALTIGEPYKFSPLLGYDFSALVQSLCASDPKLLIVGIGISEKDPFPELKERLEGRFLPLGIVTDRNTVAFYYSAADLYLDAIPAGSLTAVLDAARHGLPVQRLHFPYQPLLWCDDPGLDSVVLSASTQDEYAAAALEWLRWPENKRSELGNRFRNAVLREHCGKTWKEKYLDPAIISLTSTNNGSFAAPPEDPKAAASVCFGLERVGLGADWPAGMFVASIILRTSRIPLRIRISGILHSIKPMLFDTAGDGNFGQRFLMFRWLVASVDPQSIFASLRKMLRAVFGRSGRH